MKKITFLALFGFAVAGLSSSLYTSAGYAQNHAPAQLDMLQRADGARVVPERFLRSWDPVTIFFDRDTGPEKGGPEDSPERYVTMQPAMGGAWQWLGPRALQFRPAEKWKPLQDVTIKGNGINARLVPLLPVPESTNPNPQFEDITGRDLTVLTFAEPVDMAILKKLTSIELRPTPGIAAQGGQLLGAQDFSIIALERKDNKDKQSYLVQFKEPVPDGRIILLKLKLSDEPGLDDQFFELLFRSPAPFTIKDLSCGYSLDATIIDGITRCTPYTFEGEKPPARSLTLSLSAAPAKIDIIKAREAIRMSPPVDDLNVVSEWSRLKITGKFLADTVYTLSVAPGTLNDGRNRPLEGNVFTRKFAFASDRPTLDWDAHNGIVERLGPQMIPMRGGGYEKADIRIHAIDPLARDFWPFPQNGVVTEDTISPPLPGNEPKKWLDAQDIEEKGIVERIKALGSPGVSDMISLPIRRGSVTSKFGIDLKPFFSKIAGANQPGSYLIGMRAAGSDKRQWARVQVTDLALAAVEEPSHLRFVVTSLTNAAPVADAQIRLEMLHDNKFVTLALGTSDATGAFVWKPGDSYENGIIKRIVVTKGLDTLVIEPDRAPSQYARENWTKPETPWLSWTITAPASRADNERKLCHVFTERPIYRPEEAVHVKGFVRSYLGGRLSFAQGNGTIIVTGPNDQEWRIPVKLDSYGGFYHKFDAATPATGHYRVHYEPDQQDIVKNQQINQDSDENSETAIAASNSCGDTVFKKEAYRLPTFEVLLNAPNQVALEGEFSVGLVSRYFSGGLVSERPVKWRASQFPYTWTPPGREGFLFSSDARFSNNGVFKATPVIEREDKTDTSGAAHIVFDTSVEPTAQPRRYQIEATVTGEDDIQVRNVTSVIALPPFVLGVKVPRYIDQTGVVEPEILAVNGKGDPLPNVEMTVRLLKRNWTSMLKASDFSQGSAKYVTEVVDETITEQKLTSAAEAKKVAFETKEAGVYIIQLEASDKLGRRQRVNVDFFVSGNTPVTWARPPAQSAEVTSDKDIYNPDETATLVIQSPFQTARALAIVEEPDGRYRYDWVDIVNGFGRYSFTVRKEEMPKIPVHFLIMRGRLPGTATDPNAPFDQGKPVTIAATKWIQVSSQKNIVTATLDYPKKARTAQDIEVTLKLADETGKPLSGRATFWMVDQAVLSLAKEQPLDPLTNFIVNRPTKMAARDTRNMAFGIIPLEEVPGGDGGLDEWGTDSNISVRKNFTPVPIYLPDVVVGSDGIAKIKVKLPDSLTVFKLRAKVVSGPDRFGFATGEMMVRQELIAQPILPRFVRPGDMFDASVLGRVIEGPSGTGRLNLKTDGLKTVMSEEQQFSWQQNKPARIDFPVIVPDQKAGQDKVRMLFSLVRDADKASDNIQIDLPIRADRPQTRQIELVETAPGKDKILAAISEPVRPGSFQRSVTLAVDPTLIRIISGLNALATYPYGCTEQRVSIASAALALKPFAPVLAATGFDSRLANDLRNTIRVIEQSIDNDGLVAFWPKGHGNVSLTAWSYRFLIDATKAGEPVPKPLIDRLANVLKLSLRSDYGRLMSGEEIRERVEALTALGEGGQLDEAYIAELARQADGMPTMTLAQITTLVAKLPGNDKRLTNRLLDNLFARVTIVSRNGKRAYGGQTGDNANPLILPSETRSLAEITRAVAVASPEDERLAVLRTGLTDLADASGWGNVNADSAAIRALTEIWKRPASSITMTLAQGTSTSKEQLDGNNPLRLKRFSDPGAISLHNGGTVPVLGLVETRYLPLEPGFRAQPLEQGFVLTRTTYRVPAAGGPLEKLEPGADGALHIKLGDTLEEVVELVNPQQRNHVALTLPLAAGLDPLNPALATAPLEAAPSSGATLTPSWTSFGDDKVMYAYDTLPKGNYRFLFRTRALIPGTFTQPPGEVEDMYNAAVYGASAGRRIVITR